MNVHLFYRQFLMIFLLANSCFEVLEILLITPGIKVQDNFSMEYEIFKGYIISIKRECFIKPEGL